MILKSLRICLLLCVAFTANAQKNFVDAIVYHHNGDSIQGQISYQEWYINPDFIVFKAKNATKTVEFRPKDIAKFVIKGKNEIYESATLDVLDQTERDLEAIDAIPTLKEALQSLTYRRDTAFLLVLEKGEGSLYSYIDNKSLEHFFVKKGKGKYIELMKLKFKITENKIGRELSRISYLNVEDYKTRLVDLTGDCPKFEKVINTLEYSQDKLADLINSYNECVDKKEYSKKATKAKIKYFVNTGLSVPMAQVNGLFYNNSNIIVGKLSPMIGGGFETIIGRELSPLRIGAEIYATSNKYQGELTGSNRSVSYNSKFVGVHLFPFLKVSLYNKKQANQSVSFKFGTILTYYTNSFCEKTYVQPANLFPMESFDLTKKALSIVLSAGYQFKHIYVEGLFQPFSQNLIIDSEDTFKAIGGTLKVGYIF